MKARIIAIGDEILIGQTLDTNSNFLATELTQLGFTVESITDISDDQESIFRALNENPDIDLTLITGGLGPTKDDITKKVLAEYFETKLIFNEEAYKDVCAILESFNGKMNPLNRDQALFPQNAEIIRNEQGTAPAMWFNRKGKITVSMPGVPFEMRAIFVKQLIPKLKSQFELQDIYYQNVMFSGIGESPLALKIKDWETALPADISLAYLPSPGLIKLRLGIKGNNVSTQKKQLTKAVEKLQKIVPEYIYSIYGEKLEVVVGNYLKNKNLTISSAESCTGGKIASFLTSVAGSSAYFKGAVIAYSNEIKERILEVNKDDIDEFGAVSKSVVEQMAWGAKKLLNTDYAVATSGIAGPDGGSDEKPVGTVWVAVAGPSGIKSQVFRFGKQRDINILRSTRAALNFVRKEIISN